MDLWMHNHTTKCRSKAKREELDKPKAPFPSYGVYAYAIEWSTSWPKVCTNACHLPLICSIWYFFCN